MLHKKRMQEDARQNMLPDNALEINFRCSFCYVGRNGKQYMQQRKDKKTEMKRKSLTKSVGKTDLTKQNMYCRFFLAVHKCAIVQ